jgi:hypothetical protein
MATVADDFDLWREYVDPKGELSKAEFHEMTLEEKITIQIIAFWLKD